MGIINATPDSFSDGAELQKLGADSFQLDIDKALSRAEAMVADGAIFISIDDHEVHNVRHLLDEIFGADNFIATVIWQKNFAPKNSAKHISVDHDYVVVYARDAGRWRPRPLPRVISATLAPM